MLAVATVIRPFWCLSFDSAVNIVDHHEDNNETLIFRGYSCADSEAIFLVPAATAYRTDRSYG